MSGSPAAAALALLALVAAPFDLPPLPHPDEGYAALWQWLRTVNGVLSIPDAGFRWKVGGFAIPVLLLLEVGGIRKTWKLFPFLTPFWLIFGGIAFGALGGVAATAAHLVLFPIGRIWFTVRDRSRAREGTAPGPATTLARPRPAPPGAVARPAPPAQAVRPAPPPLMPRGDPAVLRGQDLVRAALGAIRAAAEKRAETPRSAAAPGRPPARSKEVLRAIAQALRAAEIALPPDRAGPPPLPHRLPEATGEAPRGPDLARFHPDLSRFRRRLPRG